MNNNNGPTTMAGLFASRVFKVPSFQRAFAWEIEPHLQNFLQDLKNHPLDPEKKYFLGTVLLTELKEFQTATLPAFAVVDGQQRMTTSCLFINAALSKLKRTKEFDSLHEELSDLFIRKAAGGRRKFCTVDEDDGFFEFLLDGKSPGECNTPSQKRLLNASNYFDSEISKLSVEETHRLVNVLCHGQLLVYSVNSNAEATLIFELQNDRGKRLTDLEALKSYLMHGLYLHGGENTEVDLGIVQRDFAEIYRTLESIEAEIDSPEEDQLLAYHCIAFEKWTEKEWNKPKQLVQRFLNNIGDGKQRAEWIKNFSRRLKESFVLSHNILKARDKFDALGDFSAIGRSANYWPLLMKCWKHDLSEKKEIFCHIVKIIERFVFRSMIAGKRSNFGESEARTSARDFNGDFETLASGLAGRADEREILRLFKNEISSENFYDNGRVATYLLWKYENHLRSLPGQQFGRLGWKTIGEPDNKAVEYAKDHIEPKDESNQNLYKKVRWNKDDPTEEESNFSEVCLHRLGNLVLDTRSAGSAKGNKGFADRVKHYTASGLLSQSELVSRFAKDKSIWDIDSIRDRQNILVKFAEENI